MRTSGCRHRTRCDPEPDGVRPRALALAFVLLAFVSPPARSGFQTSCAIDLVTLFREGFERGDLCLWKPTGECVTSNQIAAVHAGGEPPLPIERATVTYLLPAVGLAEAAFFVQAEPEGPAVMVDVDPATLSPPPAVGDLVSFQVDGVSFVSSQARVVALSGWTRVAALGGPDLVVDRSLTADLVSALPDYESEMTRLSATVTGTFSFDGAGWKRATIETAAVGTDPFFLLHVESSLQEAAGLAPGCEIEICGAPLWRLGATAQPLAATSADLAIGSCPAPQVTAAAAIAAGTVAVWFDRPLAAGTLAGDGSQFTFDQGLSASAASFAANDRVLVTTGAMSAVDYTVTVAGTLLDTLGAGIDAAADEATFPGYVPAAGLRINEIDYDQETSDVAEFVEIYNGAGVAIDLDPLWLVLVNGFDGQIYAAVDLPAVELAPGAYYVVCGNAGLVANCDLDVDPDVAWIQNGNPDAMALAYDAAGTTLVDAVSYEGVVPGYAEGAVGAPPDPSSPPGSIGRCPDGSDSDDNSADFVFASPPTPGAANACAPPPAATPDR